MTSDAIADAVVATFNAIPEGEKKIQFQAKNPPFVPEYEREAITGVTVDAYAFDEREDAFDNGDACRNERTVNVVVIVPLNGEVTKAIAMELVEQLRASLHESEFGRYRWESNETVSLYDNDALKKKQTLISIFRSIYTNFG